VAVRAVADARQLLVPRVRCELQDGLEPALREVPEVVRILEQELRKRCALFRERRAFGSPTGLPWPCHDDPPLMASPPGGGPRMCPSAGPAPPRSLPRADRTRE